MTNEYYPISSEICHHFYNDGGCSFCGYHSQKRTVSKTPVTTEEQIRHFDSFAKTHFKDIKKSGRLVIAPNGSWFSQVPRELRQHIYEFVSVNGIGLLKYESRATLFNLDKARREFEIMYQAKDVNPQDIGRLTKQAIKKLTLALDEMQSNHMISFGLEVADDGDLHKLNKGCCLDDYVNAADKVHNIGAHVCTNILIAPHRVKSPIYKAFKTAKFAAEELRAAEFLIMPCIPMKGTQAYDDWVKARWNPTSATAASEVFRIMKAQYPLVNVVWRDLRVFNMHGRHGKFKRKPGKWSEEEKQQEREKVRKVAGKFFKCQ